MNLDVSGLITEGQAAVGIQESQGPTLEVPLVVLVHVGRTRDPCCPWVAYLDEGGRRAVVHTALGLQELHEMLEADKTFGPAAARYYRLWRSLKGFNYESACYQSAVEREGWRAHQAGALSALLSSRLRR